MSTGRPSKKMERIKLNIEYLPPTKVAYFRRVGIYGFENKSLMKTFKNWLKAENLFENSTILGIALDDPQVTPDQDCRYDVCLVTDKEDFQTTISQSTLTGGKYAVFKIEHTKEAIQDFYTEMPRLLTANELVIVGRPIIERYRQSLVTAGYCEMMIPVK